MKKEEELPAAYRLPGALPFCIKIQQPENEEACRKE